MKTDTDTPIATTKPARARRAEVVVDASPPHRRTLVGSAVLRTGCLGSGQREGVDQCVSPNRRTAEPPTRGQRCAIYASKSTEDGLEQEFNSLDAQREVCTAYVLSKRHEGWSLLSELYDDGGFSGGSMDPPGLKRLLADIEEGRVDTIIIYKVDRLTRSLADIAKIVDVLDAAGASFVSISRDRPRAPRARDPADRPVGRVAPVGRARRAARPVGRRRAYSAGSDACRA